MANELIELLLLTGVVGTKDQNFEEKFKALISRTPNTGAPSKQEFFTHFFLGAVLTLPYTELMKKIGIKSIHFKPIRGDGHELKTVKLCFNIEHNKKKKVVLVTVTTVKKVADEQYYNIEELGEITKKLKLNPKECEIDGKIIHINSQLEGGLCIIDKSSDLKSNLEKIKDYSNSTQKTFLDVKKVGLVNTNFEAEFSILARAGDLEAVSDAVKSIFKGLVGVYQSYKKSLDRAEAAYHGFVYGVLALLFKYQNHLDIHIERTAGRGNADMMFIARGANKSWDVPPVIVEFKFGTGASAGMMQMKSIDYATNVIMRTLSEDAILLAVDPSKDGEEQLEVESRKIFQSKGFLPQLLKLTKSNIDRIMTNIESEAKYLCNFTGSDSVSKLIFGQILALQGIVKKQIFIHNNKLQCNDETKLRSRVVNKHVDTIEPSNISTFLLNKNGEYIVLNIVQGSNIDVSQINSSEFIKDEGEYIQVNVAVDQKRKVDIKPLNVTKDNGPDCKKQKPDIREISGNIDLVNYLESEKNLEEALKRILDPYKDMICNEKDFHGILHGLLLGQDVDGRKVRVFTESNISGHGNSDLMVSVLRKEADNSYVEDKLVILELKYAKSEEELAAKLVEARGQKQRYTENLKLMTDKRNVIPLTVTFCNYAKNLDKFVKVQLSPMKDVGHTSQSEGAASQGQGSEATESADESDSEFQSSTSDNLLNSSGNSSGYNSFNSSGYDPLPPLSPDSYAGDCETDTSVSPNKPFSTMTQANVGGINESGSLRRQSKNT